MCYLTTLSTLWSYSRLDTVSASTTLLVRQEIMFENKLTAYCDQCSCNPEKRPLNLEAQFKMNTYSLCFEDDCQTNCDPVFIMIYGS